MGRQLGFARLIALATVWHGETRAQTALKQVDHINRKRDVNDPENLNFLEAVDDAGRSAGSQNMRAAWQLKPWREEIEDGMGYSCKVRKVNTSDRAALDDWTEYPTAQKAAAASGIDESAFLKAILNDGFFARADGVGFDLAYTCVLVEEDGEQWKASGRDRVEVSNHGRLRIILTKDDGSKLYLEKEASVQSETGRRFVCMPTGEDDEVKKWFMKRMSHLVLECFEKGTRRLGYEARHLNGECDDDRLSNLDWGTHAENENDKDDRPSTHRGDACSFAECDEDGNLTTPWTSRDSLSQALVGAGLKKNRNLAAALENETPLESPNGKYYRFRDDSTLPPAERGDYECLWVHKSHLHRSPPIGLIQQFTTTHNMFCMVGDDNENHTFIITDIENSYYDAIYEAEDLSLRDDKKEDDAIHYKRLTVYYKRAARVHPVLGLGWRIADADEEATAAYVHEMDDCYFFDADAGTEHATSIAAQYEHQRTHGKKRKAPAPAPAPRAPAPPAPPAARFVMPGSDVIPTGPAPAPEWGPAPAPRAPRAPAPPAPLAARFVLPGSDVIPTGPAPAPAWGPAPPPRRTARSTKQRDYAELDKGPLAGLFRGCSWRPYQKKQRPPPPPAPASDASAADDAALVADASDDGASDAAAPAAAPAPAPMDDESDDDDDDGVPEIPGTTI